MMVVFPTSHLLECMRLIYLILCWHILLQFSHYRMIFLSHVILTNNTCTGIIFCITNNWFHKRLIFFFSFLSYYIWQAGFLEGITNIVPGIIDIFQNYSFWLFYINNWNLWNIFLIFFIHSFGWGEHQRAIGWCSWGSRWQVVVRF